MQESIGGPHYTPPPPHPPPNRMVILDMGNSHPPLPLTPIFSFLQFDYGVRKGPWEGATVRKKVYRSASVCMYTGRGSSDFQNGQF